MNGYVCFYASKRFEVYANTLLEAKTKAIVHFNVHKQEFGCAANELSPRPSSGISGQAVGDVPQHAGCDVGFHHAPVTQ